MKLWRSARDREPLDLPDGSVELDLVRVIGGRFADTFQWPRWKWVRSQLGLPFGQGTELLERLPQVGLSKGFHGRVYGLFWTTEGRLHPVLPTTEVRLTIAGLHQAGADEMVEAYLVALAAAVEASKMFQPGPNTVENARFMAEDVAGLGLPVAMLAQPWGYDLLRFEPPFAYNSPGSSNPGTTPGPKGPGWSFQLSEGIERYEGVTSVEEYLAVVVADLGEANQRSGIAEGQPRARPRVLIAMGRAFSWVWAKVLSGLSSAVDRAITWVLTIIGLVLLAWLGWLKAGMDCLLDRLP